MEITIRELEQRYCVVGDLYHRHLEKAQAARREGAFLASAFWIADYWIAPGELQRGHRILGSGLRYGNDLFPEEVDERSRRARAIFPLGLVHASFLAAVADYHAADPA